MNIQLSARTNLNVYQASKPVFLWDSKLSGFGVKINPSGKHSYIIQYRNHLNKTKRETIAPVNLLSMKEAKQMAKETLLKRVLSAQGQEFLQDATLNEVVSEYMTVKDLKPNTLSDMRKTIDAFMSDLLDAEVKTFTKQYVKDWYLADKNKARPAYTDRCYRYLHSVFEFAGANNYIDSNPFNIIKALGVKYKIQPRENHLNEMEIRKYWQAIEARYDNPKFRASTVTLDMVKLYMLTAMRKTELYHAYVDDTGEQKYIVIPKEVTKNKKEHSIPVIKGMEPLLYLLYKRGDDEKEPLPKTIRKTLVGLSDEVDNGAMIALHDLRRSTATLMAHLKVDSAIISRALNHTLKGITEQVYIQRKRNDTVEAFQSVSNWLI